LKPTGSKRDYTINEGTLNVNFFYVPAPPLVLDTVTVVNPTNFGFRLFDTNGKLK
jgi:hypothetical protein